MFRAVMVLPFASGLRMNIEVLVIDSAEQPSPD
jgi:hypothetical protein